jgi:phosphohistidine phosphatase
LIVFIYFLRHASAGKSKSNSKQDDKRPLDKEGIRQCASIGRALSALDTQVDVILSSPLKRAAQTASLVANELGHESNIVFTDALGKDAEYEAFQELVRKHMKRDAIMVVGHNPTLSTFISRVLSGAGNDRAVELKKGAVARVEYDGRKPGSLEWCLTPKAVETIQSSATKSSRPKTSRK